MQPCAANKLVKEYNCELFRPTLIGSSVEVEQFESSLQMMKTDLSVL